MEQLCWKSALLNRLSKQFLMTPSLQAPPSPPVQPGLRTCRGLRELGYVEAAGVGER